MTSSTDSIKKEIRLNAPLAKVWKALTTAEEFGDWFGVVLKGQSFVVGQHATGQISCRGYEHVVFDILVERIEPQRLFSYRWHPFPVDSAVDYSKEPRTLVVFELEEVDGAVLLKVEESGFDSVPEARRQEAFRMNTDGWEGQLRNIAKHMEKA